VIDEIGFRYQNPSARNLVGARVYRTAGPGSFLGTVGVCTPDPCAAMYEQNPPPAGSACIVEGTATSTTGRIQLFTKRDFLPTMAYEVRLVELLPTPEPAITSNPLVSTIVRLPGAQNDRSAFYSATTRQPTRGNDYTGGASAVFYRPLRVPSSPHRFEVLFSYYHLDGRLFAADRLTSSDAGVSRLSGISDSFATNGPPPWRVVIRMRETAGEGPGTSEWVTCNSDRPYTGQARCTTGSDRLPAAAGAILTEDTRELTTPGL
jgi:hypothetical protein